MRLLTLLALAFIALTAMGVFSFHWTQDSVSVEFDKDRAKEVTERAIDAGKDITERIRENDSKPGDNAESEEDARRGLP